ncbi:MAG: hypothetical protein H6733_04820 [Alphaproteobacteria bacterium]|nr:hypothetical protein [Alphaproteobacteria bacterium]
MDDLSTAVANLFEALARHDRLLARGDVDESRQTGIEVGGHVAHVVSIAGRPARGWLPEAPPRPVAVAMARALFSVPHLSRTLSVYTTASETVVFQPTESLAEALGLPLWHLEEIRGDIDLGVAKVLKQSRALHWFWQRAGNPRVQPEGLFGLLFPGATDPQIHHFGYRGCRMYAVFEQSHPPPPEALFLRWLPGSERWTCMPDSHFAARYLDPSTVRAVCRAVGADEAEVRQMLDNTVCAVPADGEQEFIRRDRWRSEGWSALTGLGEATPGTEWVTLPLAPDAIAPDEWLVQTPAGLALQGPRRIFDRHAMTRLTALMHGIYAEMAARLLAGDRIDPATQAWLFDLDPYIQRTLQPMLDWATNAATHRHLAGLVGAEPAHVGAAMAQVRDDWLRSARTSWGGAPTEQRPYTVQSILASHLAVVQSSLHRVYRQEADDRAAHHRILLLFFAHYVQSAPLGRLWRPVDGRLPPVEDVVGEWFWGTWQRVLEATDAYVE